MGTVLALLGMAVFFMLLQLWQDHRDGGTSARAELGENEDDAP